VLKGITPIKVVFYVENNKFDDPNDASDGDRQNSDVIAR
jgi:hypothetical protein